MENHARMWLDALGMAAAFEGRIERLEIARGHDGLFRGAPEPVLMFALYVTNGTLLRMIGRSLHRFGVPKDVRYPARVLTSEPHLPSAQVSSDSNLWFVTLAIALEEDGGLDTQRLFGAVERPDLLSVWGAHDVEMDPVLLSAVPRIWNDPRPIELSIDGSAAGSSCSSDKWIGAVCCTIQPRPVPSNSDYRLHFLAPDKRNDWTALVTVRH